MHLPNQAKPIERKRNYSVRNKARSIQMSDDMEGDVDDEDDDDGDMEGDDDSDGEE